MFKELKKKLIVTLVALATTVTVVVGISAKTLSMLHDAHTPIKNSQTSNIKENYVDTVTEDAKDVQDSQNENQNDGEKDLNLLTDIESSSDNSQHNNENTNKQTAISTM